MKSNASTSFVLWIFVISVFHFFSRGRRAVPESTIWFQDTLSGYNFITGLLLLYFISSFRNLNYICGHSFPFCRIPTLREEAIFDLFSSTKKFVSQIWTFSSGEYEMKKLFPIRMNSITCMSTQCQRNQFIIKKKYIFPFWFAHRIWIHIGFPIHFF